LTNPWQNDDDDNQQQQGKDPVRAQLKQLEKQNKDLMEKLAAAEKANRANTIRDVLTEKKLNPKLAKLVPSDVAATPDAIAEWLKDFEDLFPAPKGDARDDAGSSGDTNNGGDVDPEEQDQAYLETLNAMTRLASATSGGKAPGGKGEDLMRQILDPKLERETLVKLIEQHGGGVGMG
jgi:hypothetical protein